MVFWHSCRISASRLVDNACCISCIVGTSSPYYGNYHTPRDVVNIVGRPRPQSIRHRIGRIGWYFHPCDRIISANVLLLIVRATFRQRASLIIGRDVSIPPSKEFPLMRSLLVTAAALVAGAFIGTSLGSALLQGQPSPPPAIPKEMTSYRDVVKKVLPAVVSIEAHANPST